jgi:hypothetical protein
MQAGKKISAKSALMVFCYGSLAFLGFLAASNWLPRFAGGAYSVLGVPFYNLVCLAPTASSFPSALLSSPPAASDYLLFLSNQGCSMDDAEQRAKSTEGDSEDLPPVQPDDPVSNLFTKIGQIMWRNFVEGTRDTAHVLIPLLRRSVLAKAAYFFCYSLLIAVLLELLNLFLRAQIRKPEKPAE